MPVPTSSASSGGPHTTSESVVRIVSRRNGSCTLNSLDLPPQ